ncbi:MAG: hypothetical protein R3D00_22175 [Bacteroidia bacterium]
MAEHKRCTGWWKQYNHREEMEGLLISIDGNSISGSGYDVVGMFILSGILSEDLSVNILKQYIDKHSVNYKGQFDGISRMWGLWTIDWMAGPWEIQFREKTQESYVSEKEDIMPSGTQTGDNS